MPVGLCETEEKQNEFRADGNEAVPTISADLEHRSLHSFKPEAATIVATIGALITSPSHRDPVSRDLRQSPTSAKSFLVRSPALTLGDKQEGHFCFSNVYRQTMAGYSQLSGVMAAHPEIAVFRTFAILNTQNLLYHQAELVHLEEELRDIAEEDRTSDDPSRKVCDTSWLSLSKSVEAGGDPFQWQKILEIRSKLAEYSKKQWNNVR